MLLQPRLFQEGEDFDPLGEAYCEENGPRARRAHGITLTPRWLVERMLDRLQGEAFETIVDCGAGTGRFAITAARRFPSARVLAIESHPDMVALLRQHVWESGLQARIEVIEGDFREVALPRRGRTLYLGNPPYVRHHDIEPAWKAWYSEQLGRWGIAGSQLAGLHAHFFVRAASVMRPGDKLCFVTSAEWLDNGYGQALRALLDGRSSVGVEAVWLTRPQEQVFLDALVSSVVVEAGCGPLSTEVQMGAIFGQRFHALRQVNRPELNASGRWSEWARDQLVASSGGIELGEIFRVTRGQVTGANEVWVLPAGQERLPPELVVPAVTKAAEIIQGQVGHSDGVAALRRVVDLPTDLDALPEDVARAAKRFVQHARRLGAHQSYVARHRQAWWAVGMRQPPAAFVSYMGRRPPVFRLNPHQVSYLNIAHGLYPRQPLEDAVLARILGHLNSTTDLHSGRVYGGGLSKFEPSDVSRLRIPEGVL